MAIPASLCSDSRRRSRSRHQRVPSPGPGRQHGPRLRDGRRAANLRSQCSSVASNSAEVRETTASGAVVLRPARATRSSRPATSAGRTSCSAHALATGEGLAEPIAFGPSSTGPSRASTRSRTTRRRRLATHGERSRYCSSPRTRTARPARTSSSPTSSSNRGNAEQALELLEEGWPLIERERRDKLERAQYRLEEARALAKLGRSEEAGALAMQISGLISRCGARGRSAELHGARHRLRGARRDGRARARSTSWPQSCWSRATRTGTSSRCTQSSPTSPRPRARKEEAYEYMKKAVEQQRAVAESLVP